MDNQGDMIQMNNLIIICFGLLDTCQIFLYDMNKSLLDSINIESKQTYKKPVKCFKINEDKILVLRNLEFIKIVGNYTLVGLLFLS